jgi:ABC-2 type transport system ATP-binding protein
MQSFTLLGHNGAGKTTLINYLLSFFPKLSDHPFLKHFSEHFHRLDAKSVGYAPEGAYLDSSMSAKEYFSLIKSIKNDRTIKLEELLQSVSLQVDIKKPIKTYSKGMKQRLLLALSKIGNPKTIILDEPTSGLDPFGKELIESLLLELNRSHNLIISTHSVELAYALKNPIVILKEGEIVYQGSFETKEALELELQKHRPEVLR